MPEILSITKTNDELRLKANKSDYAAFAAGVFGPLVAALTTAGLIGPGAPVVASMLGGVISFVIPNQKIDRVVVFLNELADRLKYLEEDFVKEKLKTEEFADLLEDGVMQSSRALTPERRAYIASLLTNSLTEDDLDHIGKKKLLSLLNTVNDAEIILLKFYSLPNGSERDSMVATYGFISPNLDKQSQERLDQQESILFQSYWGHLVMTSLIYGNQGLDEKPTKLGLLLLKYIGLNDSV